MLLDPDSNPATRTWQSALFDFAPPSLALFGAVDLAGAGRTALGLWTPDSV